VANKAQLQQKKPGRSIPPVAIVAAVVGVLGVALFFYLERESHKPAPPPPPLTGMAKAYVGHLKLLDVEMNAKESYLKQSVVEITGKIGNEGDRVLQFVEINCVFYDAYGQVVLRERVPIVSKKMGNLAPGEIKSFRLAFDIIPESWNQAMPSLVIARIDFA
jgi:hypothetical protein